MYYEEGGNNTKLSCGEIPIPIIHSDEKIRQYSNGDVFPLALYPADFTGYTIGAFHPTLKEVYDLYDFSSGTSILSLMLMASGITTLLMSIKTMIF